MGGAIETALRAASAAQAGTMELIEVARERVLESSEDAGAIAVDLRNREVPEILSDALQSTLTLLLRGWGSTGGSDHDRELHEQLLAAVARYLEGWA